MHRMRNELPALAPRRLRIAQGLLALFFMAAGILHFVFPAAYLGIMPTWLPWPVALVAVSGACEIAGGLGVLYPSTRSAAGIGLIALCVAVLPANVQMLLNAHAAAAAAWWQLLLVLRLPLQLALVVWIRNATDWRPSARMH